MLQFVLGLAGVEMRLVARRLAGTALLFALAGTLMAVAAVAVLVAVFIALAERYDPLVAALLVAALAFVCGAVLLLVAYARLKAPRRAGLSPLAGLVPPAPAATVRPINGGVRPPPMSARTVIGVAIGAAVLGVVLGRRL
ncbi:MAG TPA: phage holin family protein [Xanthobacteraceae bacterium]|nr:phage holin family protein [Xanthobacteraceae bacterium]